ncbi:MAG: hypothetical protein HN975_16185 [Anaerolineae bacterium]|nr:hypothetical protein [Anaerolineae bacterium]
MFITSTACSSADFTIANILAIMSSYSEQKPTHSAAEVSQMATAQFQAATQAHIAATQAHIAATQTLVAATQAQIQTVEAFGTFYVATANAQTATAAPQSTQCDLFKGAKFSHVYGPWLPGTPLPVNIKMPASVAWQELDFNLKIGEMETENCAPLEGNNTRLSCIITLPSEYAGTYNKYDLALQLDGCGEPIYTLGTLGLPMPEQPQDTSGEKKEGGDAHTCDPYAYDQIACESGGGIWDIGFSSCTCPIP